MGTPPEEDGAAPDSQGRRWTVWHQLLRRMLTVPGVPP
jgi:hypothetical protein